MTYQSAPNTSEFRELKSDELESISGGLSISIAMLEELVKPHVEDTGIIVTGQSGGGGLSFWTDVLVFNYGGFFATGEGILDGLFAEGGEPFVTVSFEDEDLDGDGEPGITVTAPPIQAVYAGIDQIYVRLFNNGEFIEYTPVYDPNFNDYYVFFSLPDFEAIANGTYTVTYNQPSVTFSFPPSIGATSPSSSYTFTYEEP